MTCQMAGLIFTYMARLKFIKVTAGWMTCQMAGLIFTYIARLKF